MVHDHYTDLIIRYLMDDLTDDERKTFELSIEADPALKQEFEIYREVISKWQNTSVQRTPAKNVDRFNQWLGGQIDQTPKEIGFSASRRSIRWKYAIAAGFLILVTILVLPKYYQTANVSSTSQQKELLLQLVNAQNTTSRIKGINQYQSDPQTDPDIRDVLIRVLEKDQSVNVRLAALDALSHLSKDEHVKSALIRILENDNDSAIRMAIINTLVKWKDSSVKGTLQDLLDQEEVPEDVKEEAFLGVTRL